MTDKNIDKAKGRVKEAAGAANRRQTLEARRPRRPGQEFGQERRGQGRRHPRPPQGQEAEVDIGVKQRRRVVRQASRRAA